MQEALEQTFARLLLGPQVSTAEELAVLCANEGLPAEDAAELTANFARLGVYRELIRGTLREAIELALPRTIARLGATFDAYFARFLAERGPRTHYLRDVTREWIDFCEPLFRIDSSVAAHTLDLARHEALHIEVSALPAAAAENTTAPLELERGVAFSPALRLVRYEHAVHELPADEADRSAPSRRPVTLLVYRSSEHEVRYLETSPLAAAILERLLAGEPLGAALREGAAALGQELGAKAVAGCAELLADLAARGVIRGPAPRSAVAASAPPPAK